MKTALLALAALLLVPTAEASPRHRAHHGSHARSQYTQTRGYRSPYGYRSTRFTVGVNPWTVGYAPAYRAGWDWIPGNYDRYGYWRPGYWRPTYGRPGAVWVVGHWVGPTWIEGYWRPTTRYGYAWVDGWYDTYGSWHEGYWRSARGATYYEVDDLRDQVDDLRDENAALREELEDERRDDARRDREDERRDDDRADRDADRRDDARGNGEDAPRGGGDRPSRHHDPE